MSRRLKLVCAAVALGSVALVAYYGLNRGVYIGSNMQPFVMGQKIYWSKNCLYFSLSAGIFVRPNTNWADDEQVSHGNVDKMWCELFAPKLVALHEL